MHAFDIIANREATRLQHQSRHKPIVSDARANPSLLTGKGTTHAVRPLLRELKSISFCRPFGITQNHCLSCRVPLELPSLS